MQRQSRVIPRGRLVPQKDIHLLSSGLALGVVSFPAFLLSVFLALPVQSIEAQPVGAQPVGAPELEAPALQGNYSLPTLPDPGSGQPPLAVSGLDAQPFRDLIPDALYPVVRSGEIALGVYDRLPWDPAPRAQSWLTAPEHDCLSKDGRVLGESVRWNNAQYPCGPALTLARLLDTTSGSSVSGSQVQNDGVARRWLLNMERAIGGSFALQRRELLLAATGTSVRAGAVRVDRLHAHLLPERTGKDSEEGAKNSKADNPVVNPPLNSPLLWRERIGWLDPQPLRKAGALTLRFRGAVEDIYHISSPISGRFRELTGSNRSDELYGLPVSAEDLLVWGEKNEWLENLRVVGRRSLLVPVVGLSRLLARSAEPGCFELTQQVPSETSLVSSWSHGLFFAAREVVEIEASSADPFTVVGMRRVFIDTQTMLPVMKIVYDRTGQQMRVVLGSLLGFSLGDPAREEAIDDPKSDTVLTTLGPVLAVGTGGRLALLYPEVIMSCSHFSPSLNSTLFDLRELARNGEQEPAGPESISPAGSRQIGSRQGSEAGADVEQIDER